MSHIMPCREISMLNLYLLNSDHRYMLVDFAALGRSYRPFVNDLDSDEEAESTDSDTSESKSSDNETEDLEELDSESDNPAAAMLELGLGSFQQPHHDQHKNAKQKHDLLKGYYSRNGHWVEFRGMSS
jgi:hypothetical protein